MAKPVRPPGQPTQPQNSKPKSKQIATKEPKKKERRSIKSLEAQTRIARLKVSQLGGLVDITKLSSRRLRALIEYYRLRGERARSPQMKDLYLGIADDLRRFQHTGQLPTRLDALTVSRCAGVLNVRWFVNHYWHGEYFSEEDPLIPLHHDFEGRKERYVPQPLPPDQVLCKIHDLGFCEGNLKAVLTELAQHYCVRPPTLLETSRSVDPLKVLYDPLSSIVNLNTFWLNDPLSKLIASIIGFFHHLSKERKWRFSDRFLIHLRLEKAKANQFTNNICDRLVELGYLRKRK